MVPRHAHGSALDPGCDHTRRSQDGPADRLVGAGDMKRYMHHYNAVLTGETSQVSSL